MDLYYEISVIKSELTKILELLQSNKEEHSNIVMYDIVDLQRILKVSKRTIATWKSTGKLPFTQVGAKTWVTEDQLKAFLNKNPEQ